MATTPPTLPKIGTSAIWYSSSTQYGGPFTYRYNAANSTTDYAVYALHYDDTDETYAGGGFSIKVGITSGSDYNTWLDASLNGPPTAVIENSDGTVSLNDSSGNLLYKFTKPTSASWITSGPTVSSITSTYIVTNDTVSNTDFTLLKNGSAYANTHISLTAATITLPSDAQVAGYTYNLQYDGTAWYKITIDSKTYENFYYDDSWTSDVSGAASGRNTNSNRILNILGTIPSTTTISSTSVTLVKDTNASSDRYVIWYSANAGVNNDERDKNYGMYVSTSNSNVKVILFYYPEGFGSNITYSSEYTIGNQETMSYTAGGHTITVQDWVYSEHPEGSGYVTVSTTSNGGGKPDRYPLIMTNLFNRNRSLYSIGMTHKDTWDLFL